MKNQSFHRRVSFAIQGIRCAWRGEASFRQQAFLSLGVLAILLWRRPEVVWRALLLMNCGLVLAAELFNTALEHALDHLSPERHPAIQVAKDCGAGAVLLLSRARRGENSAARVLMLTEAMCMRRGTSVPVKFPSSGHSRTTALGPIAAADDKAGVSPLEFSARRPTFKRSDFHICKTSNACVNSQAL